MPEGGLGREKAADRQHARRRGVGSWRRWIGQAPRRLPEGQPGQHRHQQTRQAQHPEHHPPGRGAGEIAAADRAQQRADGDAQGEDGQGRTAPERRIQITDHRYRRRLNACFAHADHHPAEQQLDKAAGEPAERGENREHAHRDGDQADPAAGVGQPGQGQSQDGVEQGETDAADQAELHVAELQVLLDGPTEREERRPVDHRNGRDHHRQGQEPDPIGARKLAFSRLLHRHHPPARLADAPC